MLLVKRKQKGVETQPCTGTGARTPLYLYTFFYYFSKAYFNCPVEKPYKRLPAYRLRPWQFLYFRPLPHGQGSLRPTVFSAR